MDAKSKENWLSKIFGIHRAPQSVCVVCGSEDLLFRKVLWDELIEDWQLSPEEVIYIDKQQGLTCRKCGNNLRSMVLAKAILSRFGEDQSFEQVTRLPKYQNLRVLEINEAGNLTPFLRNFPGHELIVYPEADMQNLKLDTASWDLVIHSDTLEHVPDPTAGLKECCRILRKGGACIFTVPTIVGRLSRSRNNLKPSYHGNVEQRGFDFRVATEFGADIWCYVLRSGFASCKLHAIDYPAGIAIEAAK
jgi:SAM-dependent methyltransferase